VAKPTGRRVAWPVGRDPGTRAPGLTLAIAYAPGGRPWPGSGIRDPPDGNNWPGSRTADVAPGNHQVAKNPAYDASSTSKTRSKPGTRSKQHEQNMRFWPARRTSKLGILSENLATGPGSAAWGTWPGSLLISGQNPRKSAKNRQKSTAAPSPRDGG